jgi:hypothetical protein
MSKKPRASREREPFAVSVREALELVPIGRAKFFRFLANGTIKSTKVGGNRLVDYQALGACGR